MWRSTLAACLLGAMVLGVFATACWTFDMGPFLPPADGYAQPGFGAALENYKAASR